MESVVHKTFGNVCGIYSVVRLEVLQIHDAFVGYTAGYTCVEDVEFFGKAGCKVVGIDNGHLGRLAESVRSEQLDVGVRDRCQQRASVGG